MTTTIKSNSDGSSAIQTNGVDRIQITTGGDVVIPGSLEVGAYSIQKMLLFASQATTSGTSVDFTAIPSWAKRVTIPFSSVSISGSDLVVALLGTSAGFVTSGYQGTYQLQTIASPSAGSGGNYGINFALSANFNAADVRHGVATLVHIGGNLWALSGTSGLGGGGGANTSYFAGSVQLPGALDRIRIATSGSNTFDGGSVSILVEGY